MHDRHVRVGIADHLGWAVVVTANAAHEVVDRRRIELVEPDVNPMPVHHGIEDLDDAAAVTLIAEVRASAVRATAEALDDLVAEVPSPVTSMFLRVIPPDFPQDISVVRQVPWEARADAVMYREVLAEAAAARGWAVLHYEAKSVEAQAAGMLGGRADEVLHGPRARLGPPWAKDHRTALAATIVGG